MHRQQFNDGWTVSQGASWTGQQGASAAQPVTLPHDAMIREQRNPSTPNGRHTGFFPGGTYVYQRTFTLSDAPNEPDNPAVYLDFEGVYMNAMVYINGHLAGQCPYGYSQFYVRADAFLHADKPNEVRVIAKTGAEPNSRWYSGSGIYRCVHLLVGERLHVQPDGVQVTAKDIEAEASLLEVATHLVNDGSALRQARVQTEILTPDGTIVAADTAPITVLAGETDVLRQRVRVPEAQLWSVDEPNLYQCRTTLLVGDHTGDTATTSFGIRRLQLDAQRGLRINGEPVNLRGACIHHDNGVLGAATFPRAEERRVELLKAAGFNAVRSAHHPMSRALLDACDRHGMLVMDETFDTWTLCKTDYDYGLYFADWWERDVESMVRKDYNHPCVIIYSIGNEIPELGTPHGAHRSRRMAETIRALDPTRYITNSVNGMLCVMDQLAEIVPDVLGIDAPRQKTEEADAEEVDINAMMSMVIDRMGEIAAHPKVAAAIEETCAGVDIAGYNYMYGCYAQEKETFPNRVICGSETMPPDIAEGWQLVQEHAHVIGDFTWTGWDYLGEAGIGRVRYEEDGGEAFLGAYPWYIAYTGDIDILGQRRPGSYYREIVFGLRTDPYIAVQRPQHYGQKFTKTPWAWNDVISSWTWPGYEENPVQVEVYAAADEVELLLNGRSLGRQPAGEAHRFTATFETVYEPGELTAVAYTQGEEIGRMVLPSADSTRQLQVTTDTHTLRPNNLDLAYIAIRLTDERGVLQTASDSPVTVTVNGPGVLQGFGSADPRSEESFDDTTRTTYQGHALAVIRATEEPGTVQVHVEAPEWGEKIIEIVLEG